MEEEKANDAKIPLPKLAFDAKFRKMHYQVYPAEMIENYLNDDNDSVDFPKLLDPEEMRRKKMEQKNVQVANVDESQEFS